MPYAHRDDVCHVAAVTTGTQRNDISHRGLSRLSHHVEQNQGSDTFLSGYESAFRTSRGLFDSPGYIRLWNISDPAHPTRPSPYITADTGSAGFCSVAASNPAMASCWAVVRPGSAFHCPGEAGPITNHALSGRLLAPHNVGTCRDDCRARAASFPPSALFLARLLR
jgi:hypothetical protein